MALIIVALAWTLHFGGDAGNAEAKRLAELEARMKDVAAAAGSKPVAALTQRVAELEAARTAPSSSPNPQLAERLSAMETQIKTLSDAAASLRQRSEAVAASAESAQRRADAAAAKAETAQAAGAEDAGADRQHVAALDERMSGLERAGKALQSELAQQQSTLAKLSAARADARAVRLAVVAALLKAAVASGEGFGAELEVAKSLAADAAALAPLDGFAEMGVPTAAALGQKLRAVLPAMRRAAEPRDSGDGGFLQRLQVNAEKLVRIRPVGNQAGDDPAAVIARAETALSRGDLAGVLTQLTALPPAVRAPADAWIKAAQARAAALAASRRFAADHVGALAGPSE
jgi:hypothetical protein